MHVYYTNYYQLHIYHLSFKYQFHIYYKAYTNLGKKSEKYLKNIALVDWGEIIRITYVWN